MRRREHLRTTWLVMIQKPEKFSPLHKLTKLRTQKERKSDSRHIKIKSYEGKYT
jgi:hypothetical protein